jgi:hypothetical protein
MPRGQRDGSLRPYSRFSRQEPLRFYHVAPQLYSRGWVDPVPDPLLFFPGSAGNRTRASGTIAKREPLRSNSCVQRRQSSSRFQGNALRTCYFLWDEGTCINGIHVFCAVRSWTTCKETSNSALLKSAESCSCEIYILFTFIYLFIFILFIYIFI